MVLNALPKIALGPIIIIWAGAGTKAIVTMAFMICIIVTIMSLLSAFTATDDGKIFLLKSMGATKWQILVKLVIPSSVPSFTSLMKINVGLSWVGTIMGEYLVSGAGWGTL
ncbi:MAG: ABC transporter permease [Christensenellales bacterium]